MLTERSMLEGERHNVPQLYEYDAFRLSLIDSLSDHNSHCTHTLGRIGPNLRE